MSQGSGEKRTRLPMLNEQPSVCGPCGGNCCKNGPGRYHPSDFADLAADLPALIDRGGACLDWWEGEFEGTPGPVYYVRPREKRYENRALHAGWERTCSNLTDTGCALPWDSRPYGCRALVPKTAARICDYPEKQPGDTNKMMAVRWWLPHQELLAKEAARLAAKE